MRKIQMKSFTMNGKKYRAVTKGDTSCDKCCFQVGNQDCVTHLSQCSMIFRSDGKHANWIEVVKKH